MQIVDVVQAKTDFLSLLKKVERGEQIIITKHGHAVARIIPIARTNNDKRRLGIKRLKEFSQQNTLGDLHWKTLLH